MAQQQQQPEELARFKLFLLYSNGRRVVVRTETAASMFRVEEVTRDAEWRVLEERVPGQNRVDTVSSPATGAAVRFAMEFHDDPASHEVPTVEGFASPQLFLAFAQNRGRSYMQQAGTLTALAQKTLSEATGADVDRARDVVGMTVASFLQRAPQAPLPDPFQTAAGQPVRPTSGRFVVDNSIMISAITDALGDLTFALSPRLTQFVLGARSLYVVLHQNDVSRPSRDGRFTLSKPTTEMRFARIDGTLRLTGGGFYTDHEEDEIMLGDSSDEEEDDDAVHAVRQLDAHLSVLRESGASAHASAVPWLRTAFPAESWLRSFTRELLERAGVDEMVVGDAAWAPPPPTTTTTDDDEEMTGGAPYVL